MLRTTFIPENTVHSSEMFGHQSAAHAALEGQRTDTDLTLKVSKSLPSSCLSLAQQQGSSLSGVHFLKQSDSCGSVCYMDVHLQSVYSSLLEPYSGPNLAS